MALVRKYKLGNSIENTAPVEPYIAEADGLRFTSSSALNYLGDKKIRNHFSLHFKRDTPEQNSLFNDAVDKYILGILNGDIEFYHDGLRRKDGTAIEGIDDYTNSEVLLYFMDGLQSNLIAKYDERYKKNYSLNSEEALKKVLSKFLFGTHELVDFNTAWDALDPMDPKTGLRGIAERKKAYIKSIRAEANRLRTDSKYRNYFEFPGWETNLKAYEDMALKLDNHADSLERMSGFNKDDESWYTTAILAGILPDLVKNLFETETATSREIADKEKKLKDEKEAKEKAQRDAELAENLKKTMENYDPLSTKDAVWWKEGTPYTINDTWQSLKDQDAYNFASNLLAAYLRQRIKEYWGHWGKYTNRYLENLTPLFTSVPNGLRIYSVSKGALGNNGKIFFIRNPQWQYPQQATIHRSNDGTYYAMANGKKYNLGEYDPDFFQKVERSFDELSDLGTPFTFPSKKVFSSIEATNDYWNHTLLKMKPSVLPPTVFRDMLYKLSNLYLTLGREYSQGKYYKGFTFIHSNNTFGWKFRGHNIKFIFNGAPKVKSLKGKSVFDASNLTKVTIDDMYKLGGKIESLYEGGDLVAYQEQNKVSNKVKLDNHTSLKPLENAQLTQKQEQKTNPQTYGGKSTEDPFTGADAVRLGASLLDLLGSFMIFPKGLNIASAVTSGTAFLGYLAADMYDVIDGKADFWPTLANDVEMLGVMALPMFVNQAKAKAWGAGDKLAKVAGLISKWWGTAVAAGLMVNPETRKSVGDTIKKTFVDRKWSELDAHDFSNLAFILRTIGGSKELYSNIKVGIKNNKVKKESQHANIKYVVKTKDANGKEVVSDVLEFLVKRGESLTKKDILERIHKELNKDKVDESGKPKVVDGEPVKLIDKNQIEIKTGTKVLTTKTGENKELTPKWESDDYSDLTNEQWYPNRIWQRATKDGEMLSRENTTFGRWMRSVLGEEFDVSFSDYALTKAHRLGKIKRLGSNLFGGLAELRKIGKELEDIRLRAVSENWSLEMLNGALLTKMSSLGYNSGLLNSDATVLKRANAMADFYAGTLSKYDDLLIALALYDLEKPIEELALVDEVNANNTPAELPAPASNEINFDLYVTEKSVTPEELLAAYENFKEVVNRRNAENLISTILGNIERMNKNDKIAIADRIFGSFNKDNLAKAQRLNVEALALLLKSTRTYNLWKLSTSGKGLLVPKDVTDKIITELSTTYDFNKKQINTIRQLLSKSNFVPKRYRTEFNQAFFGDFKPLNLNELIQNIRSLDVFNKWLRRHSRATSLPGDIHTKIFNEIKDLYNYSYEDMQRIGTLLNGSQDGNAFVTALLTNSTYKEGGTINFVGTVLKMKKGAKTKQNPDNPKHSDVTVKKIPRNNLTWAKILSTLAINAGNWDIRNVYKDVKYRQVPLVKEIPHVIGDDSDIRKLRDLYSKAISDRRALTADDKVNTARALALFSDMATKLLDANKTYRASVQASLDKANEVVNANLTNAINTENTNREAAYKSEKEQQEYTAATKKVNLHNLEDTTKKLLTEGELLNDYRRHASLEKEKKNLETIRDLRIAQLNQKHWGQFSLLYDSENPMPSYIKESNFYNSQEFMDPEFYPEYNTYRGEMAKILDEYNASYDDLIEQTYEWNPFSTKKRRYGYYMGPYNLGDDPAETIEDLLRKKEDYIESKKHGGNINMAKEGGASINWVKVENARMINKNINTTIRETYKSIRSANSELQKTIRAIEPLIRLLQKREIVKQK